MKNMPNVEMPRVAIVGFGNIGKIHARIEHRLGSLNAIVEPVEEKAIQAKKMFQVPTYPSLTELFANQEPNAIIIAVPTPYHFSVAKDVILNYKNHIKALLIEKPITSTLQEALELEKLIKNTNINTLIGHSEIYNPIVTKMLEIIQSGKIGTPHFILTQRRSNVTDDRLASIGDVFEDLGVHDFDIISRIFKGELQIYATPIYHRNIINSAVVEIRDQKTNKLATFILSRQYAGKTRTIEIETNLITLTADLLNQIIEIRTRTILRADTQSITIPYTNGEQIKVYGEPLLEEHFDLHAMITKNKQPKVSINEAITTMKIVDACRRSAKQNQPVMISIP